MNATNRFVNRLGLFIIGVLFLAVGATVTAAALVPEWGTWWADGGKTARTWVDQSIADTLIGGTTLSWVAVLALAVLVILIVLLVVALTRLGGGRTSTVLNTSRGAIDQDGNIIVDSSFTSDALGHTLDTRPNVLFSSVSAHRIHKTPVMQVSVTPRQNTSPLEVARDVDRLLGNLTTLTGEAIPTYLSIHSGLRSRLAHDKGLA
jgi:hypothetical protein